MARARGKHYAKLAVAGFVAIGALASATACAGLLDLRELEVRAEAAAPKADAADAAPPTYCETASPRPDFCDDFEGESDSFERWNGGTAASTGLSNRIIDEPTNSLRVTEDLRRSGHVLASSVMSKDLGVSIALLGHELQFGEGALRALRVQMEVRVPEVAFEQTDGGIGNRVIYAFAVGDSNSTKGATVAIVGRDDGELDILLIQRRVAGGDDIVLGTLIDKLDAFTLQNNWFTISLVFGTEENLRDIGQSCVVTDDDRNPIIPATLPGATATGMRVVAKVAVSERCLVLRDELDAPTWIRGPSLLLGAAFGGPGRAVVHADNVTATFVR